MDQKILQSELKNCKIRQGTLYKRSGFLKQWRQRWVVVTLNYLITFANKTCKQVIDIINLKQVKSYKSYVTKDMQKQMVPAGFKIRSDDGQFYFSGKNPLEKWSWLVTIQRLMDYKSVGSTSYNNIQYLKTKGFVSQIQFQNGIITQTSSQSSQIQKQQPKKLVQQSKKQTNYQVEKIMKQLQNQKQQLKIQQLRFFQKEKLLQQLQQNLKKQYQKRVNQLSSLNKQVINVTPSSQRPAVIVQKSIQAKPIVQKLPVKNQQKQQKIISQHIIGGKVSELKNLFEQKGAQSSRQSVPAYKLTADLFKNIKMKSKADQLHILRAKTVNNLFQEFHQQNPQPEALKFTLDFLVKMASQSKYGYYVPIVAEAKSHKNSKYLAQTFVELLTDYKDLDKCDLVVKFIEVCVFQAPGFFSQNHIEVIKNRLVDFFLAVEDDDKIQTILKNMFFVHKMSKYQKNQIVKSKMNKIIKDAKRQENKNWARKFVEDF